MKTNIMITKDKGDTVKEKLGQAITAIPGKSSGWLMQEIEDSCRLAFGGDHRQPCAMINVMLYGSAPESAYDELTARITEIMETEFLIPANRIYVCYSEHQHWGWNGSNF